MNSGRLAELKKLKVEATPRPALSVVPAGAKSLKFEAIVKSATGARVKEGLT
jgi:hypothetical protein